MKSRCPYGSGQAPRLDWPKALPLEFAKVPLDGPETLSLDSARTLAGPGPAVRRGRSSRGATVLTARQARSFRKRPGRGEDWANKLGHFSSSAGRIKRPGLWEDCLLVKRSDHLGAKYPRRVEFSLPSAWCAAGPPSPSRGNPTAAGLRKRQWPPSWKGSGCAASAASAAGDSGQDSL